MAFSENLLKQQVLKPQNYLTRFGFIKTSWLVVLIYHKLCQTAQCYYVYIYMYTYCAPIERVHIVEIARCAMYRMMRWIYYEI